MDQGQRRTGLEFCLYIVIMTFRLPWLRANVSTNPQNLGIIQTLEQDFQGQGLVVMSRSMLRWIGLLSSRFIPQTQLNNPTWP